MSYTKIEKVDFHKSKLHKLFTVIPILFLIAGIIQNIFFEEKISLFLSYKNILLSPTILITDFFEIGSISAALINVGIVGFFNAFLIRKLKLKYNGVLIAAFLTVIGFSFFGKNIYNIIPIYLGGFLFTRYQKIHFRDVIVVMMFATALAPIISELSFAGFLNKPWSLILAQIVGIFIGFIIVPLSSHMLKFHDGYNLYNIGFTAGIIGTVITSILRSFDIDIEPANIIYEKNSLLVIILILLIFLLFVITGFVINPSALKIYKKIFKYKGRLVTDFSLLLGYGITFINVGFLGIFCTILTLALGGIINGPVLAGIFTVAGFGAFGKHFRNILPVMLGVILAAIFFGYDVSSTGILIAILFSSTLAPIAGSYGPVLGIIAGMFHMIIVTNVGIIHGGINLYNNGFAGGIVAGVLIPVVDAFKKEKL